MIRVIDEFLSDYEWFRAYLDLLDYQGQINPVDGVEYPGINVQIPPGICADVVNKLQLAVGKRISKTTLFLRLTVEGVPVPHQAHNDATMGDYGMILYLSRPEHCDGGTSFVKHVEHGMEYGPTNEKEQIVWAQDTNDYDKWDITEMVDMKTNRAFVFDANRMHRPEPPNGFGGGPQDGRLVMVCFFEVFNG